MNQLVVVLIMRGWPNRPQRHHRRWTEINQQPPLLTSVPCYVQRQ
jgi:hypothetical protein